MHLSGAAQHVGRSRPVFSSGGAQRVVQALHEQRAEVLAPINVRCADATVASDRARIMEEIEAMQGGADEMNASVQAAVGACIWSWQAAMLRQWAKKKESRRWTKMYADFEKERIEDANETGED